MNSKESPSVRDQILSKIEHREVRMHSRAYFILLGAAALAAALSALLLSIFLGNLLSFMLRINGHDTLLESGLPGLALFLHVFPWWLLLLTVGLIVLAAWLMHRFSFVYRTPVLVVFGVLILVALASGFGLDHGTPFNDRLLRDADRGALPPPLGAMYQGARHAPPPGSGAYRGTVSSIGTSTLQMLDADKDETYTVTPAPDGHDPVERFSVGEAIFVLGHETGGIISAFDIHPLDRNGIPPHREDKQ